MKIAFTGDTSFHNNNSKNDPFIQIKEKIREYRLIVNLESPILNENYKEPPMKDKGGLKSPPETTKFLKSLPTELVNLSNNHINDYGNEGVNNTKMLLRKLKIKTFGVGYIDSSHNIFVDKLNKIIYLSYTTRETDHTGSPLFNTKRLQGPKRLSEELFLKQTKEYKSYKKIVLVHWGEEYVDYPSGKQRQTARDLINLGADLIIGSHSHTVQGYETYKGKYIFYSLGNFFMLDIEYIKNGKTYTKKWNKKEKQSIIPLFDIKRDILLEKIIFLRRDGDILNVRNDDEMTILNRLFKKEGKDYNRFYVREVRRNKIRKVTSAIFSRRIISIIKSRI